MKYSIKTISGAALLVSVQSASAGVIDFIDLTENATGYGESAWTSLNLSSGGANVAITGYGAAGKQYAYLDWGNAGLGACGKVHTLATVNIMNAGNTSNNCDPSNDDNVNTREFLRFVFDTDVTITNIWFNNNHDGNFDALDTVTIDGNPFGVATGYAWGANGIGAFNVAAGYNFDVAYSNEQFYISAIEFASVPESSSLFLLGLGLLGLAGARKKLH
jgi:hypothetical protein